MFGIICLNRHEAILWKIYLQSIETEMTVYNQLNDGNYLVSLFKRATRILNEPLECGILQIVCEANNLGEMQDFINSLKPRIIKCEISEVQFSLSDSRMTNMCINFLDTSNVKEIAIYFKTSEISEV